MWICIWIQFCIINIYMWKVFVLISKPIKLTFAYIFANFNFSFYAQRVVITISRNFSAFEYGIVNNRRGLLKCIIFLLLVLCILFNIHRKRSKSLKNFFYRQYRFKNCFIQIKKKKRILRFSFDIPYRF